MHADNNLARLAAHKATLRRTIGIRREACERAAGRITQPLACLDRMLALGRSLTPLVPLAAVPLAFIVQRKMLARRGVLAAVVRWSPVILTVARGINALTTKKPRLPVH